MLIALYNRVFEESDIPVMQHLLTVLKQHNVRIILYKEFYEALQHHIHFETTPVLFSSRNDIPATTDCMISLGGDGTMLDTVSFVGGSDIPILGINLGRLGFLADVQENEIDKALQALLRGSFSVEKRTLLQLDSSVPLFEGMPFALNEFTLHRKDSSQMIRIHTYLNGEFLNTYFADGLIVSTPTGSTGYSLSCSGPVVFPQSSAFVITPVAPHNLNIRPIVVPDDYVISFEVEGRTDNFLCTLDARMESITKEVQIAVKKASFNVSLLKLDEHYFLKTLRQKLYWGIDTRH